MAFERDLATFLEKYQIDRATFDSADISWDALIAIAEKKEADEHKFRTTAQTIANYLQTIPAVHSVRWRVKDTEHLIAKIIRKHIEKSQKYKDINPENYSSIIRDIVGIRALHLFKGEYIEIDSSIRNTLDLDESEGVVVYTRKGDNTEQYDPTLFKTEPHKAGYRSIHYIFSSKTFKQEIFCELQIRTLFEEGWSEIDHKVRYPDFTDNLLINEYLLVFNRLCGGADDMGTFVQMLVSGIRNHEHELAIAKKENDKTLVKFDELITELESTKSESTEKSQIIQKLKEQVKEFKQRSESTDSSSVRTMFNSHLGINWIKEELAGVRRVVALAPTGTVHTVQYDDLVDLASNNTSTHALTKRLATTADLTKSGLGDDPYTRLAEPTMAEKVELAMKANKNLNG